MLEQDCHEGIYNYCDRRCARCRFTARCRVFSLSEEHEAAGMSAMESVAASFAATRTLIEEAVHRLGFDPDAAPPPAQVLAERASAEAVEADPLTAASARYLSMASAVIGAVRPGLWSPHVETIQWFHTMIPAKVRRALHGRVSEQEWPAEGPGDADGSAKVALLGIDESLAAWLELARLLPTRMGEILAVVEHLEALRDGLERAFPKARAFVRPGFDAPAAYSSTTTS